MDANDTGKRLSRVMVECVRKIVTEDQGCDEKTVTARMCKIVEHTGSPPIIPISTVIECMVSANMLVRISNECGIHLFCPKEPDGTKKPTTK